MIVRALSTTLVWLLGCGLAIAQDQAPQITSELSSDQVIVGQPLELRIKVLVPTWMLSPPQYSSLEQPNLLVRLPERASTPTSETINGETWSGVIRSYKIYPLATGTFLIPEQNLTLTYADPANQKPIVLDQTLASFSFTATLPAAARALDPPILAADFTLVQDIDSATEITVGDAITRTVTATINGTTPILIPLLIPPVETETLRGYPKEATVTEHENRGSLSGRRRETVTYIAQAGGQVTLPPIVLNWFNVETGKVEQVKVDGLDVTITAATLQRPTLSPQLLARYTFLGLIGAFAIWLAWRFGGPAVRRRLQSTRLAFVTSEPYAYRHLNRAIDARMLDQVLTAMDDWMRFYPDSTVTDRQQITQGLQRIGHEQFGHTLGKANTASDSWRDLKRNCRVTRKNLRKRMRPGRVGTPLPPLNP